VAAVSKIMERYTGGEELRRIHIDVVETGRKLGVDMPVLALQPFVEAFAEKPHVTTGQ